MNIGMIGLGKMGANMTQRLLLGGHQVVVSELNVEAVKTAVSAGATAADSIADMAKKLDAPRVVWVMVPSGKITESVVSALGDAFDDGDIIIDGGNSNYKETMRRGEMLLEKSIAYVDVGTSGGVWGVVDG